MSSIFLIFMPINLKNFKHMENTTLMEFQNLTSMTLPNYYKMMRVDQFLKQTIALGKTSKQASELLDVSSSTINRYIKAIGINSNRKPVNRTTEEKQASMLKSIKTKATNKLIKNEMENIKSLPVDQQLSKIEEFQTKYNISPELLNIKAGSKNIKAKDKRKKNIITEMNEQQGKGKDNELHNSFSNMTMSSDKIQSSSNNTKINNPMIYSGDNKDLSALLSKNPSPALKELLNKQNLRDQ